MEYHPLERITARLRNTVCSHTCFFRALSKRTATLLNLTWFVKMVKGLLKTLWPSKGRDGAADTASKKTQ